MKIKKIEDFSISKNGPNAIWENIPWQNLTELGEQKANMLTKTKLAYSNNGVYALVDCEDVVISCKEQSDFEDLYKEDVVELFFWTEPSQILYFEYEVSPLGAELAILVPNCGGKFMGWRPWHYEGERAIQRAVTVRGGEQKPGAKITGWTAEMFFPYALMVGLGNVPPKSGTSWRGNVYRMDYDQGDVVKWALFPETGGNFHNYQAFGELIFE